MPSGIYKRSPKSTIKAGDKYNRLTAIKFSHRNKWNYPFWLFKCDCGNEKVSCVNDVKQEKIKSCGCLQKEGSRKTHGMKKTITYNSWLGMKQRCLCKNSEHYKDYGGRGIKVCKRWKNSFENFYKDMGRKPTPKHSIDRIDNNGNYEPKNCRWATIKEQENNRRNNRLLIYNGKTQTMAQWAEELEINYWTLYSRIFRDNWSLKKALKTKV